MKPDVKMTIAGDKPPRLGGDAVTDDMREFLVAYLEYQQQMHVANEDGGNMVLARRRELVADEFYNGKPWIDFTEQELKKGLEKVAGVDVQQTSDVEFCRQVFRVLTMDASVPVDSRVLMQKRALQTYIADSGLTDVVKPGGRK